MHQPSHEHGHEHVHDHGHDREGGRSGADGGDRAVGARFRRRIALAALLGLLAVVAARTIFFVDETQYVYVTQFGKPVRLHTEAGLGVKRPYQSLWRFDRRLHIFEPPPREMLTEDKENLDFSWYVCWRIPSRRFVEEHLRAAKPSTQQLDRRRFEAEVERAMEAHVSRFLQSVGSVEAAEGRLEERVQAAVAAEIGRMRLTQLVSLDPGKLQLAPAVARVADAIRPDAAEQFGIEVVDIRLKRFNYPEAVKPAVFAEIRSERERVAVQYRAEGASQKAKIESLASLQREELLAQAEREATRIRGEGEAKSMEILNAAHSKNLQFYELLKTLETYRSILDEQTTVVLSAESPLLRLLTEGLPPLANPPPGGSPSTRALTTEKPGSGPPSTPRTPAGPLLGKEAGP